MINRREFIGAGIAAGAVGSAGFSNSAGASGNGLALGFVGDVLSDRENPIESYEPTLDMLRATDVLFGNAEGPYSDNPVQPPNAPVSLVPAASNLDVFADVGFDVLSLANNHSVDGGHQALLETIERLRAQGVATCGAGADLADARKPAIIESNGVKVAYLAYASVFPMGFQATPFTPGLVPMRARNVYRQPLESYYLPGTKPQVTTLPDESDQAAMIADIKAAREIADIVVTSFHWGDYLVPYHLTDHEIRTAHLCIDNGADIVAGHHHHVLRGMEWYKGKPIFYGLGHYAFDVRIDKWPKELVETMPVLDDSSDYYGVAPRKGWPYMPLHREARMTAMGFVSVDSNGDIEFGFVPCDIDRANIVHPKDPESRRGKEIVDYVQHGCESQGINGRVDTSSFAEIGGQRGVRIVPAG